MIDIHFKNRLLEYRYTMKHKYLFLIGDSATGKTTFANLVNDASSDQQMCLGYRNVMLLNQTNANLVLDSLQKYDDFVYVLDEDFYCFQVPGIVDAIRKSNNYFIIMYRDLPGFAATLKVGLDDICAVKQVGSLYTFEPIYPRRQLASLSENIVCEDSNSGKQFLESVLSACTIESAGGKARIGRIANKVCKRQKSNEITLVYDRAGINHDYISLIDYCTKKNISIVSEIDWDSFEAYLLHDPENFVEYEEYPNAEEAAYKKLKEIFPEYDKSKLPDVLSLPIYWKIQDAVSLCKSRPRKIQF